jgi:hypothetical protein
VASENSLGAPWFRLCPAPAPAYGTGTTSARPGAAPGGDRSTVREIADWIFTGWQSARRILDA